MHSLPIFVRLAGQPVLIVGEGPAADAKARLVEAAGGIVVTREAGARLAFVALDDAGAAAVEAARLKARGLLVNVVDRPALCDFTVPAIVDRSPVIVAVGTGGASASLAKAVRERLEALLPAALGTLADAIFAAREAVAAGHPTVDARRRLWDAALAPGGPLDPLAIPDDVAGSVAAVAGAPAAAAEATLATIVLASPDPDDMTLRQLRLLNQADTIYVGGGIPAAVLDRARRDAARVDGAAPAALPPGRSVALKLSS
ncbi:MAG: siroheme synthase [Janthinobacterium lividum]